MIELSELPEQLRDTFLQLRANMQNIKLSDEEVLERAKEVEKDNNVSFGEVFDTVGFRAPVYIPIEINLLLLKHHKLLGLYVQLRFLDRMDLLSGVSHVDIAKELNISKNTFTAYKKALVEMNLIQLIKHPSNPNAMDIKFLDVEPLPSKELQRLEKTHGKVNKLKLLSEWSEKIRTYSPEERAEIKKQEILAQEQLAFDEKVEIKAKELVKKQQSANKKKDPTFPYVDYKSVLDGYRKYKGIGIVPGSAYEARYKKSIKLMFMSGYKVFDILQCMKFFNESCHKDGYQWMTHWTIETVMKKMPEWTAGKLKRPEMGDDLPEL